MLQNTVHTWLQRLNNRHESKSIYHTQDAVTEIPLTKFLPLTNRLKVNE